jgi:tRNA(Arg) A34 adenosine deaminase TadA
MSEVRKSARIVSKRDETPTKKQLLEWWTQFDAEYGTESADKSATCQVKMTCVLPDEKKQSNWVKQNVEGKTGSGTGHAEMAALDEIARRVNYDADSLRKALHFSYGKMTYDAKVTCTSKPCCVQCSIVLGALGIRASQTTKKSSHTMTAGAAWGVSNSLKTCLGDYFETTTTFWEFVAKLDQKAVDVILPNFYFMKHRQGRTGFDTDDETD